jgi:hypothetical protein
VPGARLTHAKGINEEGHVVGAYYLPGEERARAFLLIEETYHDIEATFGPPPGMEIINKPGHGVLYMGAELRQLTRQPPLRRAVIAGQERPVVLDASAVWCDRPPRSRGE